MATMQRGAINPTYYQEASTHARNGVNETRARKIPCTPPVVNEARIKDTLICTNKVSKNEGSPVRRHTVV